jgi:hypothetical protein
MKFDPLLVRHEAGHLAATGTLVGVRRVELHCGLDGGWAIHSHPPMSRWQAGDALFALLAGPTAECSGRIPKHLIVESVVRAVSKYGSHDFELVDVLLHEGIVTQDDIDEALARVLSLFEAVDLDVASAEMAIYMERVPPGEAGVMERPESLTAVH